MTTATLKAIETRYAGHLFRSRLEARVAVFLDALNCSWSYEPEGFELPFSGCYLPDFLVQDFPFGEEKHSIWIEVKGIAPTTEEVNKMRELCCATGRHGFFMVGSRPNAYVERDLFKSTISSASNDEFGNTCCLGTELLSRHQVPHSTFSPLIKGRDLSKIDPEARKTFFRELDQLLFFRLPYEVPSAPFVRASKAALSARFEHGQSGAL